MRVILTIAAGGAFAAAASLATATPMAAEAIPQAAPVQTELAQRRRKPRPPHESQKEPFGCRMPFPGAELIRRETSRWRRAGYHSVRHINYRLIRSRCRLLLYFHGCRGAAKYDLRVVYQRFRRRIGAPRRIGHCLGNPRLRRNRRRS